MRILVCILTGTERGQWPCPELVEMLFRMARDQRYQVELATIKARPVEVARNVALATARDHGFDWCVQLDNDNFMPVGTPLDVIASAGPEQHIIGLSYCIIPHGGQFALYPALAPASGMFREVEAVGGGVLMIRSTVWQKIPPPWFRWVHGENTETLDRGTGGCGEDVYFCQRAREYGFRVFTHTQLLAGHWRTCDITAVTVTMANVSEQARH
jgi:hypothetical protein